MAICKEEEGLEKSGSEEFGRGRSRIEPEEEGGVLQGTAATTEKKKNLICRL